MFDLRRIFMAYEIAQIQWRSQPKILGGQNV